MHVLSLFDGCGMARQALKNIGAQVDNYVAYEIDRYASSVCRRNHPDVFHHGDVLGDIATASMNLASLWPAMGKKTLVIGGSPCQDLSPLKNGGQGLQGIKSKLFWRYVEFVRVVKPTYFVLENVGRMKKSDSDIISKELGVQPIRINSSLFSAQNRDRLYWTNIQVPALPQSDNIMGIHDILMPASETARLTNKGLYLTDAYVTFLDEDTKWNWKFEPFSRNVFQNDVVKAKCLTANYFKMARSDNYIHEGIPSDNGISGIRKLHPIECERLQTLPDNYTRTGEDKDGKVSNLSNTQRYKMIGNGFTVKVIEHILKGM